MKLEMLSDSGYKTGNTALKMVRLVAENQADQDLIQLLCDHRIADFKIVPQQGVIESARITFLQT